VLDSGTLVGIPFYSRFAANGERALDAIAARCHDQSRCDASYPWWREQLTALIRRWNETPVHLPGGGSITGDRLAGVIQSLSLSVEGAALVPYVVTHAAERRPRAPRPARRWRRDHAIDHVLVDLVQRAVGRPRQPLVERELPRRVHALDARNRPDRLLGAAGPPRGPGAVAIAAFGRARARRRRRGRPPGSAREPHPAPPALPPRAAHP